jgi:plastocyanin
MRPIMRWRVLFAAVALLGPACGGGGDGGGGKGVPAGTLVMLDNAFEPGRWQVTGSGPYTLDNQGQALHNVTIAEAGIDVDVQPGQSQEVEIGLEPGEYEMVCEFHIAQGMTGTVVVGGR